MSPITQILLAVGSVLGGLLMATAMIWFFDLQLLGLDALATFPTGWTVLDVLIHACAIMMFAGGTRAIYVAVSRSLVGKRDLPPRAE